MDGRTLFNYARAYFLGLLLYAAALALTTLVVTLFGVGLDNPDYLQYGVGVRVVATLISGFVGAFLLARKELQIGSLLGATTAFPAVILALSASFPNNAAELVMWAGIGALGALPVLGFRRGWHNNVVVRTVAGGALIAVGYPLMIVMAVATMLYVAPLLSNMRNPGQHMEGVLSLPQLLAFIVLGGVGFVCASIGRGLVRARGEAVVAKERGRFVLFLRSFSDDLIQLKDDTPTRSLGGFNDLMFGGFRMMGDVGKDSTFESALVTLIGSQVGPVVALGKPGESLQSIAGAARLFIGAENWQTQVKDLIAGCKRVLVTLGTGGGLFWELQQVLKLGRNKLVVAFPPLAQDVLLERFEPLQAILTASGIETPAMPHDPKFLVVAGSVAEFFCAEGDALSNYRSTLASAEKRLWLMELQSTSPPPQDM